MSHSRRYIGWRISHAYPGRSIPDIQIKTATTSLALEHRRIRDVLGTYLAVPSQEQR